MGNSPSTQLLQAMTQGGASQELVETARVRFRTKPSLVEACDALHRGVSEKEFMHGFNGQLNRQDLKDDDVRVLAWFLNRNSSCTVLRCVPSFVRHGRADLVSLADSGSIVSWPRTLRRGQKL